MGPAQFVRQMLPAEDRANMIEAIYRVMEDSYTGSQLCATSKAHTLGNCGRGKSSNPEMAETHS